MGIIKKQFIFGEFAYKANVINDKIYISDIDDDDAYGFCIELDIQEFKELTQFINSEITTNDFIIKKTKLNFK
jgi:hypothetical protein